MEFVMPAQPLSPQAAMESPRRSTAFTRFLARFRTAPLRRRQALDLSRLDDRLLRDIGVSRADAEEEQRRLLRF